MVNVRANEFEYHSAEYYRQKLYSHAYKRSLRSMEELVRTRKQAPLEVLNRAKAALGKRRQERNRTVKRKREQDYLAVVIRYQTDI